MHIKVKFVPEAISAKEIGFQIEDFGRCVVKVYSGASSKESLVLKQ